MVTIKAGDYTLITSGSVIPPDASPIEISFAIEPPAGGSVALILKIEKDPVNTVPRWAAIFDPANTTRCTLTFYNIDAPLGGGPREMIRLWRYNGFACYAQIKLYSAADGPPIFHFSIFKKKEVAK